MNKKADGDKKTDAVQNSPQKNKQRGLQSIYKEVFGCNIYSSLSFKSPNFIF